MGSGIEALGWKNGFKALRRAKINFQDTQVITVGCIFLPKTKLNTLRHIVSILGQSCRHMDICRIDRYTYDVYAQKRSYLFPVNGYNTVKGSKGAKIRNRYNQVPHLTQDTNGKVTDSQ